MLRSRRGFAALWVFGIVTACASCSSEPNDVATNAGGGPIDASSDAADSSPDAAFDASSEAGHDARPDSETAADASTDTFVADGPAEALVDTIGADGPPWIVDGVATCPELLPYRDVPTDATAVLQTCIDRTPDGMTLEVDPGRYSLAAQLRLDRSIGLGTTGREGTPACTADASHGCVELFALPGFDTRMGMFLATAAVTVDHVVLHGNGFLNAHGMSIPNSCQTNLVSHTPIVVSPTAASCDFGGENVDPTMSVHYSSASWAGCIPNYPL
jgi:hypothetical protein